MKKLIPICVSAMLLSSPLFAQSGTSASPSGTGAGAGSTMAQPSGPNTAPSSNSMTSPSSGSVPATKQQRMEDQREEQRMENDSMYHDAQTSPSSGPKMNPDKSDKEDDSSY